MSAEELPAEWRGRRVGILDSLLQGRRYILARHALWYVTGLDTADSLYPSIQGWLANTHLNGGVEPTWMEFLEWYQESRGVPLRHDWYVLPLRENQGDEERTALVLLELVQEYVDRYGLVARHGAGAMGGWIASTYGALPKEWGGRPVGLLDALCWLRRRMAQGHSLSLLTGSNSVDSLYCFTVGWIRNTLYNQQKDPSLTSFWSWLRDDKKGFPGEGWHVKYLRDCQGDHTKAVWKFLDLVAEFNPPS